MKKLFLYAAVAALAISALSCQKENLNENGSNGGLVFTASIDGGMDTKTTLTSKSKVNWESADEITVNGVVYTATPKSDATNADFTKKDMGVDDPTVTFNAFYPSGIQTGTTAGGTLPAEQTYAAGKITNVPMFATSLTTSLSFKNICAVLAVTVKSADYPSVKSIKVSSSNCALSGAFTIESDDTNSKAVLTDDTTTSNTVTLTCESVVTTAAEGTVFYIAIPAQTYKNLKIELSSGLSSYTMSMTTKKDADITVAVNTVYPITFKADASVLLPGEFSVSGTKKVKFTRGNLWWDGGDFNIEDSQTAYPKTWSTDHVGHFFWTNLTDYKSGTESYMPYASSYSSSSKSTTDKFWCGVDDTITVDGQSGLYALTQDEWNYLFNERIQFKFLYLYGVSITTSTGTVENCVVIAPDGWDYTHNPIESSYSAVKWATAESAGLVCLPAAGYRYGSEPYYVGSCGDYWSATPHVSKASKAYYTYFTSDNITQTSSDVRGRGSSVRLVRSVSN